jgi:hypothetical protein
LLCGVVEGIENEKLVATGGCCGLIAQPNRDAPIPQAIIMVFIFKTLPPIVIKNSICIKQGQSYPMLALLALSPPSLANGISPFSLRPITARS